METPKHLKGYTWILVTLLQFWHFYGNEGEGKNKKEGVLQYVTKTYVRLHGGISTDMVRC